MNRRKTELNAAGAVQLDITAIILFKDNIDITYDCITSLIKYGPTLKEIFLVSNNTSRVDYRRIKKLVSNFSNVSLFTYNHPFNFQQINNWAARKSHSSNLLFINNDIEFVKNSDGLIEGMLQKTQERNVGAVGTLLLYEDETTIQHAGVYLEPGGGATHLYIGESLSNVQKSKNVESAYNVYAERPVTAVTAALCMISKENFLLVDGFNEKFIIGGGDVDLCLRLNKIGRQSWYLAPNHTYAIHKEKRTRRGVPIPYSDYYWSYLSYITAFDIGVGDLFLPKAIKPNNPTMSRNKINYKKQIDLIYPLLPTLKQQPSAYIVISSSPENDDIDIKLKKAIKMIKSSNNRIKIMPLDLISRATVDKAKLDNTIDFNKNMSLYEFETREANSMHVAMMTLHNEDRFYCIGKRSFELISKLPLSAEATVI